jgi:hypothetical protein
LPLATLLAGVVMAAQARSRRMDQREREIIATPRHGGQAAYAAQTARLEQRVRAEPCPMGHRICRHARSTDPRHAPPKFPRPEFPTQPDDPP